MRIRVSNTYDDHILQDVIKHMYSTNIVYMHAVKCVTNMYMFLYTLFCMERQVDFLILKTRPHTQELSLSANMCDENVKLACVANYNYYTVPFF
jgi:hypothetical protein